MLENAPVLGQFVITSAAILFLAKGKEAVPGLVVPLEQVAEINLGADSFPESRNPIRDYEPNWQSATCLICEWALRTPHYNIPALA